MSLKKNSQIVFHNIPYVRCTVCQAIGQRKRSKIICPCCQQKVYDKEEAFHCLICGGVMKEISSEEHDRELHFGTCRHEDSDLDKISCSQKSHLKSIDQPFLRLPYETILKIDAGEPREAEFTPAKICKCGAILDRNQSVCSVCRANEAIVKRSEKAISSPVQTVLHLTLEEIAD